MEMEVVLDYTLRLNLLKFISTFLSLKICSHNTTTAAYSEVREQEDSSLVGSCLLGCPTLHLFLTKPNSAFCPYYDRTLLLFSPSMRDKDTYALREMFQYSSALAEKPYDQRQIATH